MQRFEKLKAAANMKKALQRFEKLKAAADMKKKIPSNCITGKNRGIA